MEVIRCQWCLYDFDTGDRRPKVIPCGHTFCCKCVIDNFKENLILCPNCGKEHHATHPTDFPANFELEGILFNAISTPSAASKISSPSAEQSKPLSKKLKSITEELSSGMESKATNNKEVRSQVLQYQTVIAERELLHNQIREKHLAIVHQNDDIIQIMRKEHARIAETLKKEEVETQRMKIVNDKLHSSNSAHEVLFALEEATHCYDVLDKWNHETQENFPNSQLLTISIKQQLVEKSQELLHTLPDNEEEIAEATTAESARVVAAAADSKVELQTDFTTSSPSVSEKESSAESALNHSKLSIEEKVKRALENASVSRDFSSVKKVQEKSMQTESDVPSRTQISQEVQTQMDVSGVLMMLMNKQVNTPAENLIRAREVYALQHLKGKTRYARVSISEENEIMIHCLREGTLPHNVITIEYRDVMNLVDPSSRTIFLQFGTNSTTLGRILISLAAGSTRAQNFFLLCNGESGPSYLNSVLFQVWGKGQPGELIATGDYELNNGQGGKAVVNGAGNEMGGKYQESKISGSVCGFFLGSGDAGASKFGIVTKDDGSLSLGAKFGQVESGLNVLKEAIANYPNIRDVKITDCGVVLDQ